MIFFIKSGLKGKLLRYIRANRVNGEYEKRQHVIG